MSLHIEGPNTNISCVIYAIYIYIYINTLINRRMNVVEESSLGGGMFTSQGHKY